MASVTAAQDLFESPPQQKATKLNFGSIAAKDDIMD
jgi:hypothetical protein